MYIPTSQALCFFSGKTESRHALFSLSVRQCVSVDTIHKYVQVHYTVVSSSVNSVYTIILHRTTTIHHIQSVSHHESPIIVYTCMI